MDYIPGSDSAYDTWLANFAAFVQASGASLGLTPEQISAMQDSKTAWHNSFTAHLGQQNAARTATQNKETHRGDSQALARQLVRLIQASPIITDAQRAAAGITVPDQTAVSSSPELVETTPAPLVLLDWSRRSTMVIHYGQNPANEHRNPILPGMKGCRIFYAIGGIPAAENGWQFLVDHTRSPYVHVLTLDEPVKVAYRVQYFDRKYRTGTFSDPVEAMVTI